MFSGSHRRDRIKSAPHPKGTLSLRGLDGRLERALESVAPCPGEIVAPLHLPFDRASLAPQISPEAMGFHYDQHFVDHVHKLNSLVRATEFEGLALEDIIRQAAWKRKRALLTAASQVWNHAFFWQCLSGEEGRSPDCILGDALTKTFGSIKAFQHSFVEKGMALVGSGWLWLVWHRDHGLVITTTENTIPVWVGSERVPLLVCDLWEHAYFLDWRNDRRGWLQAFVTQRANWNFAARQMASLLKTRPQWVYPSYGERAAIS